jgi:hypothetical protein
LQIPDVNLPLLSEIIKTNGSVDSLKIFFEKVRNEHLPAGINIGDAHELFLRICDLSPELEKLCSYIVFNTTSCAVSQCDNKFTSPDETRTEFILQSQPYAGMSLQNRIVNSMQETIPDWKCDKFHDAGAGCIKQTYMKSFPTVFVFHTDNGVESYSETISINKRRYTLISGICFHNSHWWAFGRSRDGWMIYNDMEITPMKLSDNTQLVRMLIYYRYED